MDRMRRKFLMMLLTGFCLLSSCRNNEDSNNSGEVYAKYSIWGEEGKEFVNAFFQFQSEGPEGRTLLLKEPAKVFLDDHLLIPDSARETGVFYELQIPV